jgi:shikimate kinase
MGSGKSTVARLLSRQLGCRVIDLDHRIEQRAGLSIPDFFSRFGEPAFRDLEHGELARVIGEAAILPRPTILSLGGGTIIASRNLGLLRQSSAAIVWLDCPPGHLLRRCASITNRPLFRDDASFLHLLAERRPFYALSDFRVDASQPPARIVEQILALGILDGIPA